ncbi:Tannase and feruloyl esterase [compost metagenome]
MEAWVERGRTPERVLASKHEDDDPQKPVKFARPLCPYPRKAFYDGKGKPTEAASFECRDAPRAKFEDLGRAYLR